MMNMNTKIKRTAVISALLLTGLICLDSRYNLKVTRQNLSFENLPAAFEDFHIVQLSDLHGETFGRDNEKLAAAVADLKPDIIAITGDMVGAEKELPAFEALLQRIVPIAPVYYVSGNHEWGSGYMDEVEELLEKYGVEYLANEYLPLYRSGEKIILAGVDDPMGRADMTKPHELIAKLRAEYPEDFTLLLGHRNYWVEEYPDLPVQLILSGHAHGGIIRLPVVGGLISAKHKLVAEFEKGLYKGEEFVMNVSCGLGNSVFIPRMFNRPEIVSVHLSRS